MYWGRRIAVVLAVAVLAIPATSLAEQIQKYTDSGGMLHISNVPAREAKAPPAAPPAANSLTESAATPAPPAAETSPTFKKVAFTPSESGPAEPPAAAAPPGDGPAGSIRRYRDAQGVLHIANVAPAPESGSLLLAAGKPGPRADGEAPKQVQESPSSPSLRQVAWSPEGQDLPKPLKESSVPQSSLPGSIQRYRDHRGVWHITNILPDTQEAAPRTNLAALEPGARGPENGSEGEGKLKIPLKPASWSGEPALSRASPAPAPEPQPVVFSVGTVRRYRDEKGVWHIDSVAPPGPQALSLLAAGPAPGSNRQAEPGGSGPEAHGPAAAQAPAGTEPRGPPGPGSSGSQLLAFRDSRGRLHISNLAPPARDGRAPPLAPAALEAVILEAAQSFRLPVPLVTALIKVESNFVSWAVSPKGAMGLMQLMPGTATFLGVTDPFCPRQNVWAGCRYLRLLLDTFGDCLPLALAAYNAGYQRVINAGFCVPPIRETQEFVTQVLERYFAGAYGLNRAAAQGGPPAPGRRPFT